VIWILFQKIEKASEIYPPDKQNQNETEAATSSEFQELCELLRQTFNLKNETRFRIALKK
jgi:hypothetical protein